MQDNWKKLLLSVAQGAFNVPLAFALIIACFGLVMSVWYGATSKELSDELVEAIMVGIKWACIIGGGYSLHRLLGIAWKQSIPYIVLYLLVVVLSFKFYYSFFSGFFGGLN